MAKETERLNINVPVNLMERVQEYADKMAINKTSAVAVLLSLALDSQKAMSDIGELLKIAKETQIQDGAKAKGE